MLARAIQQTLYLSVLLALAVEAAPLPPGQTRALQEQIQARQRQTQTWSATFTQTLAMPGMRETVVSTGALAYRAPGRLRLDFTRPRGEFVLVVEDQLYLQKAGKPLVVQSISDDPTGQPFQSLLGFLSGRPTEDEALYDAEVSRTDGEYVLVLNRKPDAPGQVPARITNRIDTRSLEVREVFVELPEGGTLQYRFDAVARNRAIDDSRFAPPRPH